MNCAQFHLHPNDLLVQPSWCLANVNELGGKCLRTVILSEPVEVFPSPPLFCLTLFVLEVKGKPGKLLVSPVWLCVWAS